MHQTMDCVTIDIEVDVENEYDELSIGHGHCTAQEITKSASSVLLTVD